MLYRNSIEVILRATGSTGSREDAKYEELTLPLKSAYEGRYLQCFIPYRAEGFEIVVRYLDSLDMHGASTLLVRVVLKPASSTIETPAVVLAFAAEHAKNIPGSGVFTGTGVIPMLESMVYDGVNGEVFPSRISE